MTERADRLRGVLLMLAAVGFFALMDALMKHLAARYPAIQVASLRGMSSLPFVTLAYALTGQLALLRPVRFGMHLLRGLLAIAMLLGFLWALARASMADTYAVFMCAPLLVVLTAALLLGEKVGRHVWLAIVVGLGGVFVILDPSLSGMTSLAGLAGLAIRVHRAGLGNGHRLVRLAGAARRADARRLRDHRRRRALPAEARAL